MGDSKSPSHQMMLNTANRPKNGRGDSRGFVADYGMTTFPLPETLRCLKTESELVPRHLKGF
jgi:hypothetical protein